MRCGCSTISFAVRPFTQKSCQVCGFCLSGAMCVTRPPSTVTARPHRASQIRQKVNTVSAMEHRLSARPFPPGPLDRKR